MTVWFYPNWWAYLLAKPRSWRAFRCRANGHLAGPRWYDMGGVEPDMHCRNCGDNIG